MTVKELRNMIKNNEHISMTTFDELVEIADTKLSFFERIGEKGKLQREIIKSFDSIINLLDDKARPNVIHTEVKNESIRNKILAYTVRYLDDALSGKKGTRFDKRNLVKASGKSTLPGRPNLYATTSDFLDYFGLSTIKDLPNLDESNNACEVKEEKDLFTSIYKEDVEK